MRKTVLILLGVVLYLLLGAGGAIPAHPAAEHVQAACGTLDDGCRMLDGDAWERICNSDLQVPVPARLTAPRSAERVRGCPAAVRLTTLHGASVAPGRQRGYAGRIIHLFVAGTRSADYYVFLLRRLLI